MASSAKLPVKTIVFAALIDESYEIVAAGCDAIDRRGRLKNFTADPGTAETRAEVQAVLTTGIYGFQAEHMDLLPNLKIICCFGVGFENVDLDAAKARGIAVTNAPATNGDTVADHALGLLLATARGIVELDTAVRNGQWMSARNVYRPTLNHARVGIIGLGAIGRAIAQRCAAFDAEIAYTGRSRRPDCTYEYFPDARSLADFSDFLIVACPGGPQTHHLVDDAVLKALGPSGILVNIGRGTVVDNQALIAALKNGDIFGIGIDVVDGEPEVPAALLTLPNVVITPHMAGRSPIGLRAQCERALGNIGRMAGGQPLLSQVA